jgi:hypothetical protein
MARNELKFRLDQKEIDKKSESFGYGGIPVCGANFSTPVLDQAYYIDEIQYKVGDRLYIENAE